MPTNLNLYPETNIGKPIMRWVFREFSPQERSKVWWIVAGAIALGMVTFGIFTGNFLFALIILMTAIVFVGETQRSPRRIDFKITPSGIVVGKKYWRWTELERFWIAYHPPIITNLYIVPKKITEPRLTIPLEKNSPLTVRTNLIKYMSEDLTREDEPTSEALGRMLKLR